MTCMIPCAIPALEPTPHVLQAPQRSPRPRPLLMRPRLLVRAARIGLSHYDRDTMLSRMLPDAAHLGAAERLRHLVGLEADCDSERRQNAAGYAPRHHLDLLIALLAELRESAGPV